MTQAMAEWFMISGVVIQGCSYIVWNKLGMEHPVSLASYAVGVLTFGIGIVAGLRLHY